MHLFDAHSGLLALGLIAALSLATWLVSLRLQDVSVVDGMWPLFITAGGSMSGAIRRSAPTTSRI
jgi:steroid 5-alpha reductase family enzyme